MSPEACRFFRHVIAAAAFFLGACGAYATPTLADPATTDVAAVTGKECWEGCWDIDSFPEAPGLFLDYSHVPEKCFDPQIQTDYDEDGISEFCEQSLAQFFAPQLISISGDDISGEPRWAARRNGNGDQVDIVYLTNMYFDAGWSSLICNILGNTFTAGNCTGHFGDSETIRLTVDYDPSTYHWVLVDAYLSAHENYNYASYWDFGYTSSTYRGRPDVWVALDKHALYATQTDCNGGGFHGSDTCTGTTTTSILRAYTVDNIGSSAVRFMDCVYSYHPVHSLLQAQECMWTYSGTKGVFGGWQGTNNGTKAQEANGHRLSHFGF